MVAWATLTAALALLHSAAAVGSYTISKTNINQCDTITLGYTNGKMPVKVWAVGVDDIVHKVGEITSGSIPWTVDYPAGSSFFLYFLESISGVLNYQSSGIFTVGDGPSSCPIRSTTSGKGSPLSNFGSNAIPQCDDVPLSSNFASQGLRYPVLVTAWVPNGPLWSTYLSSSGSAGLEIPFPVGNSFIIAAQSDDDTWTRSTGLIRTNVSGDGSCYHGGDPAATREPGDDGSAPAPTTAEEAPTTVAVAAAAVASSESSSPAAQASESAAATAASSAGQMQLPAQGSQGSLSLSAPLSSGAGSSALVPTGSTTIVSQGSTVVVPVGAAGVTATIEHDAPPGDQSHGGSPAESATGGAVAYAASSNGNGLSKAATAGIAVGPAVGALAIALALFALWRRRRRSPPATVHQRMPSPRMSPHQSSWDVEGSPVTGSRITSPGVGMGEGMGMGMGGAAAAGASRSTWARSSTTVSSMYSPFTDDATIGTAMMPPMGTGTWDERDSKPESSGSGATKSRTRTTGPSQRSMLPWPAEPERRLNVHEDAGRLLRVNRPPPVIEDIPPTYNPQWRDS